MLWTLGSGKVELAMRAGHVVSDLEKSTRGPILGILCASASHPFGSEFVA